MYLPRPPPGGQDEKPGERGAFLSVSENDIIALAQSYRTHSGVRPDRNSTIGET
jgi:hypothetical protein